MSDARSFHSFAMPMNILVQGASRGIGLELVRQLLQRENLARVFASCRDPGGAHELKTLVETSTSRLTVVELDVCDEDSIARAAERVSAATSRLDIIVNCAGVLHDGDEMHPERRLSQVTRINMLKSFEVNALGALLVAKHFNAMFDKQERCIFATLSARVGSISDNRLGGWYAYRASKAAQNMLTKNLSIELPRTARGVICVGLHPGTVDTDLSRPFQRAVPAEQLFTLAQAARQLLSVVDALKPQDNGSLIAWNGESIPW